VEVFLEVERAEAPAAVAKIGPDPLAAEVEFLAELPGVVRVCGGE